MNNDMIWLVTWKGIKRVLYNEGLIWWYGTQQITFCKIWNSVSQNIKMFPFSQFKIKYKKYLLSNYEWRLKLNIQSIRFTPLTKKFMPDLKIKKSSFQAKNNLIGGCSTWWLRGPSQLHVTAIFTLFNIFAIVILCARNFIWYFVVRTK